LRCCVRDERQPTDLQALVEHTVLALKAHVLGPLDEAAQVALGLDVTTCKTKKKKKMMRKKEKERNKRKRHIPSFLSFLLFLLLLPLSLFLFLSFFFFSEAERNAEYHTNVEGALVGNATLGLLGRRRLGGSLGCSGLGRRLLGLRRHACCGPGQRRAQAMQVTEAAGSRGKHKRVSTPQRATGTSDSTPNEPSRKVAPIPRVGQKQDRRGERKIASLRSRHSREEHG
jgi:hypothetical protein